MGALETLKQAARRIRHDALTVYFAARHPRTPWYARLLALVVAAYALSPIDLIPDFIPVLGYLDDLVLLPLGILLVIRLVPADVITESRALASTATERPTSRIAAALIVVTWLACAAALTWWLWPVPPIAP